MSEHATYTMVSITAHHKDHHTYTNFDSKESVERRIKYFTSGDNVGYYLEVIVIATNADGQTQIMLYDGKGVRKEPECANCDALEERLNLAYEEIGEIERQLPSY